MLLRNHLKHKKTRFRWSFFLFHFVWLLLLPWVLFNHHEYKSKRFCFLVSSNFRLFQWLWKLWVILFYGNNNLPYVIVNPAHIFFSFASNLVHFTKKYMHSFFCMMSRVKCLSVKKENILYWNCDLKSWFANFSLVLTRKSNLPVKVSVLKMTNLWTFLYYVQILITYVHLI